MTTIKSGKDPLNAELATLRREIEDLKRQVRQIPSRFPMATPVSADVVVRVRFDCDTSSNDLSVGEVLDASAATLDEEVVWIDGPHALAFLPPRTFGAAFYYATKVGTATRSSTERDLYRVTDYYGDGHTAPSPLVLEATAANGRCTVLNDSEAALQTTIAGVAADNHIMALVPSATASGQRFDWICRRMRSAQALPDSVGGALRTGGNGGTIISSKLSIEHGEVFHIMVWAESGEVDSGFNPLKAASQFAVALIQHTAGGAPVVRGTGNGFQIREDTTTSSRNYNVANASWSGLVLTVRDYDYAAATITFAFTTDSYGRIVQITATSSSGDIVPFFQVLGGRWIP